MLDLCNTFSCRRHVGIRAASGKSYATVTPAVPGMQPPVRRSDLYTLFDNGLTCLNCPSWRAANTAQRNPPPYPGLPERCWNVISAANGTLSIDYYVRDGGDGACLPRHLGNTFSADVRWIRRQWQSYATVTPAVPGMPLPVSRSRMSTCLIMALTLNVSVNGVPLTQLSATTPYPGLPERWPECYLGCKTAHCPSTHYVRDAVMARAHCRSRQWRL